MVKTFIWVSHPQEAWIQAEVVTSDKDSVTIKGPRNESIRLPGEISNYDVVIPESIEKIAENLVEMEVFNEGVILHQVRQRYLSGMIYTFVGSILIALNPYQRLNIYGDELMHSISRDVKANRSPSPHVFSIGGIALHNMINDNLDQSVLISGESGAGKTETTKKVLTYFSSMAGSTASRAGITVESQILDSNPLLEGFGNAKTVRNNNSSRFGKYMEVNFDSRLAIKGCNIVSYLLEKTRVVMQMPTERNYHSFYMLLAGASKEMKKEFSLLLPEQFNYLNQSGCVDIPGRSDAEEFEILQHSMDHLTLDAATQKQIFQILAGVLHLGNVTFIPSRETEGESEISNGLDSQRVATLLGVGMDALEQALCFKESTFGIGETITIPLDPPKAADQRDAFAKFIYGKLFEFIVYRVNNILFRGKPGRNIGVLDIFGFEVFKLNSFEQLCINYCNERLQSFFNTIIFENERKMYESEEIDCSDIVYQNNIGCVRLIDQRNTGIFALLDEEVVVPRGSDAKFVARLHSTFDESPATKSSYFVRNKRKPNDFGVNHFAGEVMYTVDGFLEKNKDTLSSILINLLKKSSLSVISTMVIIGDEEAGGPSAVAGSGRKSDVGGRKSQRAEKATLATKFKTDLDSLMTNLESTVPHFIRCVKPNDAQQPNKFDPVLCLRQLKYAGLFEAIHIRKAGFSIRMPVMQFIQRYKHCSMASMKVKRTDFPSLNLRDLALAMLNELAPKLGIVNPTTGMPTWAVGLTRVFFRTLKVKYALEECRNNSVDFVALQIQRYARGYIARARFYATKMSAMANRLVEREKITAELNLMRSEDSLSAALEDHYRNNDALRLKMEEEKKKRMREEYERVRKLRYDAATKIQKRFRGVLGRVVAQVNKVEVKLERSISSRSEFGLQEAIRLADNLETKSKNIRSLQQNARDLLLEVEGENYVKEQLEDAIDSASDILLVNAIQLAEDAGMIYLESLREAKAALEQIKERRAVLSTLRGVLNRCDSVPKLLASTDTLERCVVQATALGLGGEYLVQETVIRCNRLKSLITVRNNIRYAVEVCSIRRMKSSMEERNKLLRIYGPDLCAEEANAVANMMRMFSLSPMYDEEDDDDDPAAASSPEEEEEIKEDSMLPPFVRQQLDRIRDASTHRESRSATEKLQLLVPNEKKRKNYLRLFKWVVSFATWRYQSQGPSEGGADSAKAKSDGAMDEAGYTVQGYGFVPSPNRGASGNYRANASAPVAAASARTGNTRQLPQSPTKGDKMAATVAPVAGMTSTGTSSKVSLGSKIYRQRKAKDQTLPLSESGTGTGGRGEQPQQQANYIPFSQRQSKSAVASYQAIKKRNKDKQGPGASSSKAERMIADTLKEYNQFYHKHKGDSTFVT